jgi:REP element-mobilizing transposase RayT
MSSKYKSGDNEIPHFVTFTIVGWIDVFTRALYKDILVDSLAFCTKNKGIELHAWVIMTNHVHLIISTKENSISDFVRDIKKYTSKMIIATIQKNKRESRKEWMINMFDYAGKTNSNNVYFQLWKQNYHPIELNTPRRLEIALNYLHNNPVKAGLVWEPWHYKYASGVDYYTNENGLLKISRL